MQIMLEKGLSEFDELEYTNMQGVSYQKNESRPFFGENILIK
jgi:hypothetical protein